MYVAIATQPQILKYFMSSKCKMLIRLIYPRILFMDLCKLHFNIFKRQDKVQILISFLDRDLINYILYVADESAHEKMWMEK